MLQIEEAKLCSRHYRSRPAVNMLFPEFAQAFDTLQVRANASVY